MAEAVERTGALMFWKTRRVHRMMDKYFWEGFFSRLGDGPSRFLMEFSEGPQWWTDVADLAYEAGWTYADEVVSKLGTRRFGFPIDRKIPARVVAECYAAARLTG